MKNLNALFLALAFLSLSAAASAQTSGSCGANLTWQLSGAGSNLTLTISGTGAMTDYQILTINGYQLPPPWYSQRANINTLVLPDGITTIGQNAFSDCSALTGTLTIPSSVTTIGQTAFYDCSGLTGITIPNSVTTIQNLAFIGCDGLTELTIPNSVTTIGYYAFQLCKSLKTVNFNATNCTVGTSAFYSNPCPFSGCANLTTVNIGGNVTRIPDYAFADCDGITSITIPNSVTYIGNYAFYDCNGLKGILTIPNSVTTIGTCAFSYCGGFTGLTIGSSVTYIGNYAFKNCIGLTTVDLNAVNCTFMGECQNDVQNAPDNYIYNAFNGCVSITTLNVGNDVTIIPNRAFFGCSGLTTINFNATRCTAMSSLAYYYYWDLMRIATPVGGNPYFFSEVFRGCPVTTVNIGSNATIIPDKAFVSCGDLTTVNYNATNCAIMGSSGSQAVFYGCANLSTLNIGNNVISIPNYAFLNCSGLTTLTIPNSVTSIKQSAFEDCSGLTSVNISDSVTSIGESAFSNCSNLSQVTIPNLVDIIGDYAFKNCSGLTTVTDLSFYPQNINDNVFSGVNLSFANLQVPSCIVSNYQDAPVWNTFHIITGVNNSNCTLWQIGYPNPADMTAVLSGTGTDLTLTINGNGNMMDFTNGGAYWYPQRANIKTLVIPNNVYTSAQRITKIGNYAFAGLSSLSTVTIPSSTMAIGYGAFAYCSGLTTVNFNATNCTSMGDNTIMTIDDDLPVFYNCTNLRTLNIDNNVTTIPSFAFYGCSSLTGVVIGNSVASIGDYAFAYCNGLIGVTDLSFVPQTINANVFSGVDLSMTGLMALSCALDNYKNTAVWSSFGYKSALLANDVTYMSGACGANLTWKLTTSNCNDATLTISGTGAMTNYDYSTEVPWDSQRANIKALVLSDGITTIVNTAFYNCTGLTTVTIPNSVTSIGGGAFQNCSGLTSITIPNSVTTIGDYAFEGCSGLTTVTIPNSVTSIGNWTFQGCSSLTSAIISNSATSIGDVAFMGCSSLSSVIIPNSVTSIGMQAFMGCSSLKGVTLGNLLTSIGAAAFYNCDSLIYVTNLNPVPQNINSNVFINISSATLNVPSCTISAYQSAAVWNTFGAITGVNSNACTSWQIGYPNPADLTAVLTGTGSNLTLTISGTGAMMDFTGGGAFWYPQIQNIKTLVLPEGITKIGNNAFVNCSGLTTVTIPSTVTSIGDYAFFGCIGLTSLTIPNAVMTIGYGAFQSCGGLTTVNFNATNCTFMGDDQIKDITVVFAGDDNPAPSYYAVFQACTNLKTLNIGNNVTEIPSYAFYNCIGLTSVTIPSSVTTIGDYAFYDCSGLTTVTDLNITPQNITSSVFGNININSVQLSSATLTVPACAVSNYQSADVWNTFGAIIGDETLPCGDDGVKTVKADNKNIAIYPNPVKDKLIVESGDLKVESVEITDLAGRTIINCQLSIVNSINVSSLPKGVYLVKINTAQGVITRKVVKN